MVASMDDEIPTPLPLAVRPDFRPEQIHNIIETVDRYNPLHQEVLEDYVFEQMEKNAYDRPACLAVLKLYQFNPPLTNYTVIEGILSLALGALPAPDFNLCLCLLSEDIMTNANVAKLLLIQQTLEQCRFKDFWTMLAGRSTGNPENDAIISNNNGLSLEKLFKPYPAFKSQIREFISETISISYHKIDVGRLGVWLDLKDEKVLGDWIAAKGWSTLTTDGGGDKVVVIPQKLVVAVNATSQQQQQQKLPDSSLLSAAAAAAAASASKDAPVKFEQLSKIISYSRLQ